MGKGEVLIVGVNAAAYLVRAEVTSCVSSEIFFCLSSLCPSLEKIIFCIGISLRLSPHFTSRVGSAVQCICSRNRSFPRWNFESAPGMKVTSCSWVESYFYRYKCQRMGIWCEDVEVGSCLLQKTRRSPSSHTQLWDRRGVQNGWELRAFMLRRKYPAVIPWWYTNALYDLLRIRN